jgi:hypothetical protein
MTRSITVGESFLSIHFFSIHAGSELGVVQTLKEQGHNCIFKTLGQYDVVSFIETSTLDDPKIYSSCNGAHDSRSIAAYQINTDNFKSPNIIDWVDDKPLIGFVLLELDKWLYTPDAGAQSGIMGVCIASMVAVQSLAKDLKIEVAMYGGLGRSELYAIIRTNSLDDIWTFTSACRNLTFEDCIPKCKSEDDKNLRVFTRTRTIPCISYDTIQLLDNGEFEVIDIEGVCRAYISVSCLSGFEHYLHKYFPNGRDYSIIGVLGNKDAIITTEQPLKTIDLLANILNFRNSWEKERIAPITTVTSIVDPNPNNYERVKRHVSTYRISGKPLDIKIPGALTPRLANRIKSFIHYLNSYSINRSYHAVLNQLISYTDYIQQLLDDYQEKYDTENTIKSPSLQDKYIDETALLEAIETAEMGLSQRTNSDLDASHLNSSLPMPFGEGIFSSLVALEYLINYIFISWSAENPDYDAQLSCVGFPAFSDSFGFQVRWGETIFLPVEAIYNATSSTGNWLTLTHEISHAIYLRLQVAVIHGKDFEKLHKNNFHTRENERVLGTDTPFYDQLNELFAHWYDYYHFYNKDLEQYLKNVWQSWLRLSIVHENFSEYFFRSFVIFIMNDYMQLADAFHQEKEQTQSYLLSRWDEHLSILRKLYINTSSEQIEYIKSRRDDMCELFKRYAPVLELFHSDYSNDNFRNKINSDYTELGEHLDSLKKGKIIFGHIENPYILIKQLIIDRQGKTDLMASIALIMSLKNSIFY